MMQNCRLTDRVCKQWGESWMVWGKRRSFQVWRGEGWGAEARGTRHSQQQKQRFAICCALPFCLVSPQNLQENPCPLLMAAGGLGVLTIVC